MNNERSTIVRRIILAISEHYKSNNTSKISGFVQTQYNRIVIHENTPLSLHDVNESDILLSLNECLSKLELDLNELLSFVSLVPAIDRVTKQLTAVVELKSAYFRNLIDSSNTTKVHEDFILYSTDMYQLQGNNSHIMYRELPAKSDREVIASCINFNIGINRGSCGLSAKELGVIKKLYIDIKYGGLNPFNEDEWLDLYKASTYRRALIDDALQCPEKLLGKAITQKYKLAIEMHNVFFSKQERADTLIRNDFGRVIGRKTKLFSPTELIQQKNLPRYGDIRIAKSRDSINGNEVVEPVELDPFDLNNFIIEENYADKKTFDVAIPTESQAEQEYVEANQELIVTDFFC